jgi:hypothetical protein
VLENRVLDLRGKKWREAREDCIIRSLVTCNLIKLRMMEWTGHVARVEEMRNAYKILVGRRAGRDHSENLGVNGKILGWILGK